MFTLVVASIALSIIALYRASHAGKQDASPVWNNYPDRLKQLEQRMERLERKVRSLWALTQPSPSAAAEPDVVEKPPAAEECEPLTVPSPPPLAPPSHAEGPSAPPPPVGPPVVILSFAALALGRKEEEQKGWMSLYWQSAGLCRSGLVFAVLFLLLAAAAAYAVIEQEGGIYFLAAFSGLVAEAIWSGRYLTAERLLPGLGLYGLFGLFYLGVPVVARRYNRELRPKEAGAVLILVSLALLFFLTAGSIAHGALWGLALLLLDVAIGAAALYMRKGELHLGALTASAFILLVWVGTAGLAPWPGVAILSAGALALLGCVWTYLTRRAGIQTSSFDRAAAVTILMGQIITIAASLQPGSPGIGFLISAHLVFLVTLLDMAWARNWHLLAVAAVLPTAAAAFIWQTSHSGPSFCKQQLLFAAPLYLVFLPYPLLLGRRAGRSLAPCLAALALQKFVLSARKEAE